MLLLVTLALVVASAVLLILGFVQDALGFIYVSMLCAGVAALALFVFARLARRRGAVLAGAGIASSPYAEGTRNEQRAAAEEDQTRGMAVVSPPVEQTDGDEPVESWYDEDEGLPGAGIEAERPQRAGVAAWAAADEEEGDTWPATGSAAEDWGDEVVFPIEDYDDLRVAEILPLLGQLDPDELQEVRDRELAGKARATILDRIDDRLGRVGGGSPSAVTTAALPVVEAAEPGAPRFAPPGLDDPGTPAQAQPSTSAGRAPRKAAAARASAAAAKQTAAKKTASPRKAAGAKAPAKKAPAKRAAKRSTAAQEPAAEQPAAAPEPSAHEPAAHEPSAQEPAEVQDQAAVESAAAPGTPFTAPDAPAESPARRPASRKVAAAATEPAPPSATARRTEGIRKAPAEPATAAERPPAKKAPGRAGAKKAAGEAAVKKAAPKRAPKPPEE